MNYWNKNSTAFFSLKGKLTLLLLFYVTFLTSLSALADGSKDLYPKGVKGARAYLRASEKPEVNWPFANNAVHYVYAEKDEKISLANSSPTINANSAIFVVEYLDENSNLKHTEFTNSAFNETSAKAVGYIKNRDQELAGPKTEWSQNTNSYTPHIFDVPSDGVYKISMKYSNSSTDTFLQHPNDELADNDWIKESHNQPNISNFIAAWDISVINKTNNAFIPGRVYTNLLNLAVNDHKQMTQAFFGNVKILTNDRHIYNINNNGNHGIKFTFFSNNNGFTNPDDELPKASYLSLDSSALADIQDKVHNPNFEDTEYNITHKIFYTLPSDLEHWDLPETSTGAVPGGSTWLKQPVADTKLTNISITGFEGTPNQMGNKGAIISFEANIKGSYTITISNPNNIDFIPIILSDYAVKGENTYFWDGKDNDGNIVPPTDTPLEIGIELLGGEVHFPFFDMELNVNGTIISRLNDDFSVASDKVYWDDSAITINSSNNNGQPSNPKVNSHLKASKGLSSTENGHKYGLNNDSMNEGYGNLKSLDTWTFIKAPMVKIEGGLKVKKSDLQIKPVTVPDNLTVDQPFDIEVSIFNEGPTSAEGAVFSFEVPEGFTPGDVKVNVSGEGCAKETTAIALNEDKDKFTSTIDINSGCTLTYTITLVPTKTTTSNLAISILRPADNWDIDATSLKSAKPIDPSEECGSDDEYEGCNNNTSIVLKVEGIPYLPVISNRNIYHKVN